MGYIHSMSTVRALLAVAFSVFIIAGAPASTYAASEKTDTGLVQQVDDENIKKVRKANEHKLKAREPRFGEQAKSVAKGYKETAEMVARQGGNPKPILDAAAYFESESGLVSRTNPNK